MPDPADGDLEARVRDLEHEVLRLKDSVEISRADAAAARVLAGGADRDVSDVKTLLRSHTQTLNALRDTQLEQHEKLTSLDDKVSSLDRNLDARTTSLQAQIDGLRSETQRGFGMLQTGMAQIIAALPNRNDEDDRG